MLNIFFTCLVDICSFFGNTSIKVFGLFKNQIVGSYCSILIYFVCYGWLPRWNSGKKSTCQWRRYKRCVFETWVGKTPWSRKWQPTPVFLSGKFHGQRSLAATVEGVREHQHDWLSRDILDNICLSDMSFADIFSWFVAYFFILFIVSFTEQEKNLISMTSNLSILYELSFDIISKT